MDGYPNPIDTLRHAVKTHERRRLEPDRQAFLQQAAIAAHETRLAEAEERWQSLQIEQPSERKERLSIAEEAYAASKTGRVARRADRPQTQNELTGKIVGEPKKKPCISRVAATRAKQTATHRDKTK